MRLSVRSILTALTLFGIVPLGAHADPSDIVVNDESLQRVSPEIVAQVSTFLEHFVAPHKSPDEQLSLFADKVEYYDRGIVGKEEIVRDIKRYQRQWPSRSYRVARIDLIFPDPQSDRVYVRYEVEFTVANAANAKKISGRGLYGAVIADIDGRPQVASIRESVIARKRDSTIQR